MSDCCMLIAFNFSPFVSEGQHLHVSHGFTLFLFPVLSSSLSFKSIYWLQVHPVKANKLLVLWSLFLSQKSPRLLCFPPSQIELRPAKTGFHAQNPSFLPLQPQWQLHPPQGELINYGWMFDWQRLNDRSSVLTRLPHTENLVPIVLFKTCQMITKKLFFAQPVELALSPLLSGQDTGSNMFMQMVFMKDEAPYNGRR